MKRYLPIILLLTSATVLALGMIQLVMLRFEVGDVYPEYSSLRSDPLGTMAFYESLMKLPGLTVRRDVSVANRLPDRRETTYLHLAASLNAFRALSEETFKEMERFANDGGRLVITMYPIGTQTSSALHFSESEKQKVPAYRNRLGVDYRIVNLERANNVYGPETVHNVSGWPLPETLKWYSGIVFSNVGSDWKPIYLRGTEPVMIQRTFGRGSVVMATDSYFLSNEALAADRHPDLLAFLIGSSRNVVFDEAHLGVIENPGIASLLRRYHLHWVAASFILLAALFVWKMSMPLIPRRETEATQEYIAGIDAGSGIISLLRRSVRPEELLQTCFTEWKKAAAQAGTYSTLRIQHAEAAFQAENSAAPKARNPVTAYRTISSILQRRIK